jgi:4-hydroxy-4-methyl-2-oxoglutarate aldolase
VYAYGRSMLTTRLQGIDAGGHHVEVVVGGVPISPGDVVLADANGVFAAAAEVLEQVIDVALQDDAEEPELINRIRAGVRLGDETGATKTVWSLCQA